MFQNYLSAVETVQEDSEICPVETPFSHFRVQEQVQTAILIFNSLIFLVVPSGA
jgi:hypothetical protein